MAAPVLGSRGHRRCSACVKEAGAASLLCPVGMHTSYGASVGTKGRAVGCGIGHGALVKGAWQVLVCSGQWWSPGSGRVRQRMCDSADPLFAVSDEAFRLHAAQCEEIEASKGVKGAFRGVFFLAFTCLRNSMPGPAFLYRRR